MIIRLRTFILIPVFLTRFTFCFGQELFPTTEPASTIPKGAIGVRFMYETFKELPSNRVKYWDGLRVMYGATRKLTLMLTGSASNHHLKQFPANLQNYFVNHHQRIYKPNPFLFEGLNFYAKYRVFSLDEQNKHIRLAIYGEASKTFVPHDEAEPLLMGDNSGFGGGIIGTKLQNKLALSLTCGFTHPLLYTDKKQNITFKAGDAWNYNLSVGYRLVPLKYNSYKNVNVNLYVELINKRYGGATMTVDGKDYNFNYLQNFSPLVYNSILENKYSEIRPSIQFIFNSNDRIDIGIAQPVYGKSYLHFYPMFFFHVQKYFFPNGKRKLI